MNRRRISIAVFALGMTLLFLAGVLALIATFAAPESVVERTYGDATIALWAEHGAVAFEGDCITVQWDFEGIQAVYLNDRDIAGHGQEYPCIFSWQPPTFRITFPDGVTQDYVLPVAILFPAWVRIGLVALLILTCAAGLASIGRERLGGWLRSSHNQHLLALVTAILLVVSIDLLTNSLDIQKLKWDHVHVISLAEYGYTLDNPFLAAPFAYRFTPVIVRGLMDSLGMTYIQGFWLVTLVGVTAQLWLTYLLARQLRADFRSALLIMLTLGLSLYYVKFLLFDIFRPDPLGFPLMLAAMLALLQRRYGWALLATAAGLLFREYVAVMAVVLVYVLLWEAIQQTDRTRWRALGWLAATGVVCSLVVVLPRALIEVETSYQVFDPVNNPETLRKLIDTPLDLARDWSYLLYLTGFWLPALLLLTPRRARPLLAALKPYGGQLALYTVLVLVLTMYGGGDIQRYLAYLFIPLIFALAMLFRQDDVSLPEILVMLVLVALYNRDLWMIPTHSRDSYLAYLYYRDEAPLRLRQLSELVICLAAMIAARRWLLPRLDETSSVKHG
jgi:hypothetical protein